MNSNRILAFTFALIAFSSAFPVEKTENISPCDVCKLMVKVVANDVHKYNSTIHDITNLVKDLCADIGGQVVKKECDYIVDNIQHIVEWIQGGGTPDTICKTLHLCNNRKEDFLKISKCFTWCMANIIIADNVD